MFTKLALENFKAWRRPPPIDLRPLTLVLGVNSAGKTSLLQPLLLLAQTVDSPDRHEVLSFGQPGDGLDLGTFQDVVAGHDLATPLAFRLTFGPVTVGAGDAARTLETVAYQVDYVATEDGSVHVHEMTYSTELGVYGATRRPDGTYALRAPGHPPLAGDRRAGRRFEPERSVAFSADAVAALGAHGPVAQDLALALTRELQRVSYLGPLRIRPQRHHVWTGQAPSQVGSSGEAAVPALLANLLRGDRDGSNRGRLVKQVSDWAARLGIADEIALEKVGPTVYQVTVTIQGQKASLLDVGFGVSQVLPVLTLVLFAPEGSMVVLEQPELHLHPLAQSVLGDLLVEAAQERRLQFLVETHSEHLFRRLQTLMAEERLTPDECSMLFVNRRDAESTLEPLRVNAYGRVENWPDRFFGDTAGEVERQMDRMLERMERDEQRG